MVYTRAMHQINMLNPFHLEQLLNEAATRIASHYPISHETARRYLAAIPAEQGLLDALSKVSAIVAMTGESWDIVADRVVKLQSSIYRAELIRNMANTLTR